MFRFLKNRIVQALAPVCILFLFIAGASDFGRIVLDETPEITGSNGETWSNATDGYWTTTGAISTGDAIPVVGTSAGIAYFEPGLAIDTLVHPDIYYTTIHDHTQIQFQWADSSTAREDTTSVNFTWLSSDTVIITAEKAMGSAGDTSTYMFNFTN